VELSVVIPTRDASATLGDQLRALLAQEGLSERWEIIVADNGSTDGTAELVRGFSGSSIPIRYADAGAEPGVNRVRNRGVAASRGRFVLICDADDIVEEGWLHSMWSALVNGADVVGGDASEAAEFLRYQAFLPSASGGNCGFRRDVFDDLGGFDEAFRGGGDDKDFFWRAQLSGYELQLLPSAIIRYTPRSSARGVFRQRFHYGAARPQLYAKFKESGMPRSSSRRAVRIWVGLPVHAFRIARGGDARYASAGTLGFAAGRLVGSWRHRVWYP
jgi:glycosyltransferase involved in cell wall biosynthesis